MRFGSLFSGVGGIDLGFERAGWTCGYQAEIDPEAACVLARRWPNIRNIGDVSQSPVLGLPWVDAVVGGFPCTPTSQAGKREGVRASLWPAMAEWVATTWPDFVLIENPVGLTHKGRGFGAVLGGLVDMGYVAEWVVFPAQALGAPHIRDRVWIVGHRDPSGSYVPTALPVVDRWRTWPDIPGAVPATADVQRRLRVLGRSAVPAAAEVMARAMSAPTKLPPQADAGVLEDGRRWPRAGMVDLRGRVWGRRALARPKIKRGQHGAPLPTPSAVRYGSSGNGTGNNKATRGRPSLYQLAARGLLGATTAQPVELGAELGPAPLPNPQFVEWMLDFDADWTATGDQT